MCGCRWYRRRVLVAWPHSRGSPAPDVWRSQIPGTPLPQPMPPRQGTPRQCFGSPFAFLPGPFLVLYPAQFSAPVPPWAWPPWLRSVRAFCVGILPAAARLFCRSARLPGACVRAGRAPCLGRRFRGGACAGRRRDRFGSTLPPSGLFSLRAGQVCSLSVQTIFFSPLLWSLFRRGTEVTQFF